MTVSTLINLLQKTEHKEATVFLENSEIGSNALTIAVVEHNLMDDYIAVVLKKG